jgi:hypothetical protein
LFAPSSADESPVKNSEMAGLRGFAAGLKYSIWPVSTARPGISLQIGTVAEA